MAMIQPAALLIASDQKYNSRNQLIEFPTVFLRHFPKFAGTSDSILRKVQMQFERRQYMST